MATGRAHAERRWGARAPGCGEAAADGAEAADKSEERRWGAKASDWSGAVADGAAAAEKLEAGGTRVVYTVGTWRVSREVYMWQLSQLGVKTLVDVRGNPKSGREDQLHRGKDLSQALAGHGIHYEYWGDRLGEDQVHAEGADDVRRLLKSLLATVPRAPVCLLGHMHEPHKCHRLRLCDLFPAACRITHLMWADHRKLQGMEHAEAHRKYERSMQYFYEKKRHEQQKRRDAYSLDADSCKISAIARDAGKLPRLVWQETPPHEWENRLRDGSAYRLLLPWDTELLWYPHFLDDAEANHLEDTVHEHVTMYHPTYRFQTHSGGFQETINRKGQAKVCDDFTFNVQYSSHKESTVRYNVDRFEHWSRSLLHKVEAASETVFNAIWFNHYRDGTVTIHWHTDSDEGLGPNALIGSLSLGSTRDFCLKSKRAWSGGAGAPRIAHVSVPLFHGSLLVMGSNSQTHWLHAVPAMEGILAERTNLTFRFYAHEELAVAGDAPREPSRIVLRNSKLLSEPGGAAGEPADVPDAEGAGGDAAAPLRLKLLPDGPAWSGLSATLRPILVDMPSDPDTTVAQFCDRISAQLLPDGAGHVDLGAPGRGGAAPLQHRVLQQGRPLRAELAHHGVAGPVAELALLPRGGGHAPGGGTASRAARSSLACAWPGMLATGGSAGCCELQRELQASPPGAYRQPHGQAAHARADGDWLREVLQNLSGIQRKSRGRGQASHAVFHQCSEFVAVYAGRPKSSVHLLVGPKRLLQREDVSDADAPMVGRLASYAAHLACCLSQAHEDKLFAAGLRVRAGRTQQFHGHLVSMDLSAPRADELERRHFEDFTGGASRFLPLDELACHLAIGHGVPHEPPVQSRAPSKGLSCHRCGHLFGDAMLQLSRHLAHCRAWPPSGSCTGEPAKAGEARGELQWDGALT